MNLSLQALGNAYPDASAFLALHPACQLRPAAYQAGGFDQTCITFKGIDALEHLLADDGVLHAARLFTLNLMRGRTNFYWRYQSYELAEAALGGV